MKNSMFVMFALLISTQSFAQQDDEGMDSYWQNKKSESGSIDNNGVNGDENLIHQDQDCTTRPHMGGVSEDALLGGRAVEFSDYIVVGDQNSLKPATYESSNGTLKLSGKQNVLEVKLSAAALLKLEEQGIDARASRVSQVILVFSTQDVIFIRLSTSNGKLSEGIEFSK